MKDQLILRLIKEDKITLSEAITLMDSTKEYIYLPVYTTPYVPPQYPIVPYVPYYGTTCSGNVTVTNTDLENKYSVNLTKN